MGTLKAGFSSSKSSDSVFNEVKLAGSSTTFAYFDLWPFYFDFDFTLDRYFFSDVCLWLLLEES